MMRNELRAFHNDPALKSKYLERVRAHRAADELIKHTYWHNGKGCAVGCTVHSDQHDAYESELGIPQMLARLEDCIFEGLPNDLAQEWPERFLSAIPLGADLSRVGWKFLHWLLTNSGVNPGIHHPLVTDAVKRCADVLVQLTEDELVDAATAESARTAAYAAASSAGAAAESAYAAAYAAAGAAAESAYAAIAAASSAYAAIAAARAAGAAAESAGAAAESAYAATYAAYEKMADKLIQLLKEPTK